MAKHSQPNRDGHRLQGIVYLLCFRWPNEPHKPARYRHAGHYMGFTTEAQLSERLEDHRKGQGARLVKVILDAGMTYAVTRIWRGARRGDERLLKERGPGRHCPVCREINRILYGSMQPSMARREAINTKLHRSPSENQLPLWATNEGNEAKC